MHTRSIASAALLALVACDKKESPAPGDTAAIEAAAPVAAVPDTTDNLMTLPPPRVVNWAYAQRATTDFDGDGTLETAVLSADVHLDRQGRPIWEDGHKWQLFIREPSGEITPLYHRFLPNGKLTAEVVTVDSASPPVILLVEQMPASAAVYEVRYNGPAKYSVRKYLKREIQANTFQGSPRP